MLPGKINRCLTNSPSVIPTLKQPLQQMAKISHAMEELLFQFISNVSSEGVEVCFCFSYFLDYCQGALMVRRAGLCFEHPLNKFKCLLR